MAKQIFDWRYYAVRSLCVCVAVYDLGFDRIVFRILAAGWLIIAVTYPRKS